MELPNWHPEGGAADASAMAQSLARICIHLIFSTKNREPLLTDIGAVRSDLFA
jgi:hypothetical protein